MTTKVSLPGGCPSACFPLLSDGQCNEACNVPVCVFDGGDCCVATCSGSCCGDGAMCARPAFDALMVTDYARRAWAPFEPLPALVGPPDGSDHSRDDLVCVITQRVRAPLPRAPPPFCLSLTRARSVSVYSYCDAAC